MDDAPRELSSPEALLRAFPKQAEAAFAFASALPLAQQPPARRALLRLLEDPCEPPKQRRRLSEEPQGWRWLPAALAAALPLLQDALPRDERGLCVIPHPHPLKEKRPVRVRRYLAVGGRLAYDTHRACDNCDKPIQERSWFACAQGCEVDFCRRCHARLQEVFAGRDIEHASWAAQFVTRAAGLVLTALAPAERRLLMQELAFEWPKEAFERLVRAAADVADAKVVHLPDGSGSDILADRNFWTVLGFLQFLRLANELPAKELRFGELSYRGPRVPSERFVLGAIDKCDAQADWSRWQERDREAEAPERLLLEAEAFEPTRNFALFLAHGCLVPIGFRQRCLLEDAHEAMGAASLRCRELRIQVRREPAAVREAALSRLGGAGETANEAAALLSVTFAGEAGEGPGVTREFLALALQGMLGDASLFEYDASLRSYWFAEPAPEDCGTAFHACGALLGQAVLVGTQLPAALPRVLFELLLKELESPLAREVGLADLAQVQPSIARGLKELLEYEGEDLLEVFPLSWPRGEELRPGNREEHVAAYAQWFFRERFAPQLGPLCAGFRAVLGHSELLRTHVDAGQLEQIVCGKSAAVDISAIRQNADATGWAAGDADYVAAFWEALAGLDDAEKQNFIVFVSACGRMPPQGWQDFNFCLQKNGTGDERLPTAYTCFHLLLLPRYSSTELLQRRLRAAISETEGFGLK